MREAQEYPLKIPRLSQKINSHAWLGLCTDEKNAMLSYLILSYVVVVLDVPPLIKAHPHTIIGNDHLT